MSDLRYTIWMTILIILIIISFFALFLTIEDAIKKIKKETTLITEIIEIAEIELELVANTSSKDDLREQSKPPHENLSGWASYYDYALDSGWSSVGHYVCATRDFERYSMVRATNLNNGKSIVCKVTDYGPDASIFPERIIDLSSTAFNAIADTKLEVIPIEVSKAN